MNVTFDICTTVSCDKGDDLRQTISRYNVEIREINYSGTYDTPGYTEYEYYFDDAIPEQIESLLIDAADVYIQRYGYEADEQFED